MPGSGHIYTVRTLDSPSNSALHLTSLAAIPQISIARKVFHSLSSALSDGLKSVTVSGAGSCLLLSAACSKGWGDLPSHLSFIPLTSGWKSLASVVLHLSNREE